MKTGIRFVCIIVVFLSLLSLPLIIGAMYKNRDDPRIRTQHSKAVSGQVVLEGGGFVSGTVMYILYYPGTYQRSGIECEYAAYVTELEYNRQMYGDK